ncbi:MAG: hypothetical protein IJB07_03150 [Firmicutes bacterium]|nr:hypothetical protein [Bacillota bacterium]
MGVAEAAYGIYLSAGGLSGVVDIGSSAATQYINLINSGVSPEAAGKLVGVQAVLDAVGETGVFDDAVGAAVKKSGLMDTLVEWGRKIPGAKEMIQNVKDRTAAALHRLGMDLNTWDLTRDQETEAIKLVEAANDFTDEEAGMLAKTYANNLELTTAGTDDIVDSSLRVINCLQEHLDYEWNGEHMFIPKGTEMSAMRTIAGKGTQTPIRIVNQLVQQHGGNAEDWEKRVGKIESQKSIFDVHWYEMNGQQYEPKVKFRKER